MTTVNAAPFKLGGLVSRTRLGGMLCPCVVLRNSRSRVPSWGRLTNFLRIRGCNLLLSIGLPLTGREEITCNDLLPVLAPEVLQLAALPTSVFHLHGLR